MSKKALIIMGVIGAVVILGAGAAAVHRPGKTPAGSGKPPAPVKAGEKVSAQTWQMILKRRMGMRYVQVKNLPNHTVEFTSPVNGFFTRNVTKDGFAEIKPA